MFTQLFFFFSSWDEILFLSFWHEWVHPRMNIHPGENVQTVRDNSPRTGLVPFRDESLRFVFLLNVGTNDKTKLFGKWFWDGCHYFCFVSFLHSLVNTSEYRPSWQRMVQIFREILAGFYIGKWLFSLRQVAISIFKVNGILKPH